MEMHSNSGFSHRFALQKQMNDMNVRLNAGEILLRSAFFIPPAPVPPPIFEKDKKF